MALKIINTTALDGDNQVITDANAYISRPQLISYWADRNVDLTVSDDEVLDAAIIAATDYLEARFGARFRGHRLFEDQALAWPRAQVFGRDGRRLGAIPTLLIRATCEYAKRAIATELAPDPTVDQNVVSKTETVGPITESTTYSGSAVTVRFKSYPMADAWLEELCTTGGASSYR